MTKSYADIIEMFALLRCLNGTEKAPYKFKDQAAYAVGKNMNILRRHVRDFSKKQEELSSDHAIGLKEARESKASDEVIKKLEEDFADEMKKLREIKVEVTGILVIKPSSLDLDNNAIQAGILADLMDQGLLE